MPTSPHADIEHVAVEPNKNPDIDHNRMQDSSDAYSNASMQLDLDDTSQNITAAPLSDIDGKLEFRRVRVLVLNDGTGSVTGPLTVTVPTGEKVFWVDCKFTNPGSDDAVTITAGGTTVLVYAGQQVKLRINGASQDDITDITGTFTIKKDNIVVAEDVRTLDITGAAVTSVVLDGTNPKEVDITIAGATAGATTYDNEQAGFDATNVQDAIDYQDALNRGSIAPFMEVVQHQEFNSLRVDPIETAWPQDDFLEVLHFFYGDPEDDTFEMLMDFWNGSVWDAAIVDYWRNHASHNSTGGSDSGGEALTTVRFVSTGQYDGLANRPVSLMFRGHHPGEAKHPFMRWTGGLAFNGGDLSTMLNGFSAIRASGQDVTKIRFRPENSFGLNTAQITSLAVHGRKPDQGQYSWPWVWVDDFELPRNESAPGVFDHEYINEALRDPAYKLVRIEIEVESIGNENPFAMDITHDGGSTWNGAIWRVAGDARNTAPGGANFPAKNDVTNMQPMFTSSGEHGVGSGAIGDPLVRGYSATIYCHDFGATGFWPGIMGQEAFNNYWQSASIRSQAIESYGAHARDTTFADEGVNGLRFRETEAKDFSYLRVRIWALPHAALDVPEGYTSGAYTFIGHQEFTNVAPNTVEFLQPELENDEFIAWHGFFLGRPVTDNQDDIRCHLTGDGGSTWTHGTDDMRNHGHGDRSDSGGQDFRNDELWGYIAPNARSNLGNTLSEFFVLNPRQQVVNGMPCIVHYSEGPLAEAGAQPGEEFAGKGVTRFEKFSNFPLNGFRLETGTGNITGELWMFGIRRSNGEAKPLTHAKEMPIDLTGTDINV